MFVDKSVKKSVWIVYSRYNWPKFACELKIQTYSKSLFRFLLRATNGQNSPQFRCKNAHVALTCPRQSRDTLSRLCRDFQRFLRLIGANFSSFLPSNQNPEQALKNKDGPKEPSPNA